MSMFPIGNRQSAIGNPKWVAGFFVPDPDPHSAFEVAMSATVLPGMRDIDPARFLPSSRSVAFLKAAWEQIGGYPEWLDYCEDLVFDFKLRDAFGQCAFAPDALVYFRPRSSLRSFFKQYYLYARGDGKANLWFKRHLARYATYCAALPTLLAGMALSHSTPIALTSAALLVVGVAAYTRAPYRRLATMWQMLTFGTKLQALLLVPILRVVGDGAKMLGYPVGVAWRLHRLHVENKPAGVV
jgi:GT2 family glycosyltransferase